MILYLDTSLLVASLTNEASTSSVQSWLAAQAPGCLAISEWVRTEFAAALSIKIRSGALIPPDRDAAWSAFQWLVEESIATLPVTGAAFRVAAGLAAQEGLGLRAGDALHLAICLGHNASICTLDQGMRAAAEKVGVPVAEVAG